ncbi:Arrestin-N domain-containing protein [Mycena kentingensis (nom. inval.)]|nr:Arrestin-N domain-containing protein [Mycena kentingensis (nom. inval.)]
MESTDGPLKLHFQNITRIAGETLTGRVDIDFQQVQQDNLEEVRIKFVGVVNTKISIKRGNTTTDYRSSIQLFHVKFPLWTQGTVYPDAGQHTLSIPFQWTLPVNLPPSFHCEAYHRNGTVAYSLEVVGQRAGMFRFNRRIRRVLQIVPAALPHQLAIKESLMQGWTGQWKSYSKEDKLRRGIWGDYAHARARLTLPDVPSFPIGATIPFSLYIETDTKPMDRKDAPEAPVDKHGKPLFPAPPQDSSLVSLKIHRWSQVRAKNYTRTVDDNFTLTGGLGEARKESIAAVGHTLTPAVWIPAGLDEKGGGKGVWRRSLRLDSKMTLVFAPTFQTEIIQCAYQIKISIDFPGIGNDLKLEIPIQLDPGTACPPPPIGAAGGSGATYADVPPPGPPPQFMDLPPSYFAGNHHSWDADEKS